MMHPPETTPQEPGGNWWSNLLHHRRHVISCHTFTHAREMCKEGSSSITVAGSGNPAAIANGATGTTVIFPCFRRTPVIGDTNLTQTDRMYRIVVPSEVTPA